MKNNLELWSKVETTDKKFTKKQSFGAKLTAIDQMYQFKNATELFGPFGIGWGVKEETYQKVDSFIIYTATLWYKYNGDEGAFPISSDQKLKDDCIKSVQTDAITKGLSRLGFNADIFLGTFDGNKYIGGDTKDTPNVQQQFASSGIKTEPVPDSGDRSDKPFHPNAKGEINTVNGTKKRRCDCTYAELDDNTLKWIIGSFDKGQDSDKIAKAQQELATRVEKVDDNAPAMPENGNI